MAKSRKSTASAIYVYSGISGNTIAGGTFTAIAKTSTTARGIYADGNITVSGGTFNVSAATTSSTLTTIPCGIYAPRGTVTVNGNPTFNVTSGTSRAYGAFAYATIGSKGTVTYPGHININGGTFNVTTTTTTAYGTYAGLASLNLVQKGEVAKDTIFGQHYAPGIIEITGGSFNVTAKTTTACGIVVAAAQSESGFESASIKSPITTITGGKFNVESVGDDNATAYAMNALATADDLKVQGGWYNTDKTNASSNPTIGGKYTAPTKDCNYHVLDLEGEDPYLYEVAEAYTITFNANGQGTAPDAQTIKKDGKATEPVAPTAEGYTFGGWFKEPECMNAWDFANDVVTGNLSLYAKWESTETGFYVDIVDVDNSAQTLTLNVTGWASSGWPYTVNGTSYEKTAREADRTLIIPYTGEAGGNFTITVVNSGSTTVSKHTYIIPTAITSNATLDNQQMVFVKPDATLTVDADKTTENIYVAPGAKLIVNSGVTLSADTVFLRTTPWASAELELDGTLNAQVCYTRIISKKKTPTTSSVSLCRVR